MKKVFTLIAAAMMAFTASAADPDLANDYALVKSYTSGNGAITALSTTALSYKVNNVAIYPVATADSLSWIAMQGLGSSSSNGWYDQSDKGLWSRGGGRSASINYSELTTGWIVAINCTQTASNVITMVENASAYSITTSADGKTVFATIVAKEGAHVDFAGNKNGTYISSINVYKPTKEVKTVNYTINYKLGDNTVKTVEESTVAGSAVSTLASFKNDDNTVKYIREAGESDSFVPENDTTVVVKVRIAGMLGYIVNAVTGTEKNAITTGSLFEGDSETAGYPRYILSDNTLYNVAQGSSIYYGLTVAPTTDNQEYNVNYSVSEENTNVVFYAEAENIEGVTAYRDNFTEIRTSNAAVGIADSVAVAKLEAGKYTLTSATRSGTTNFYVNGENILTMSSTGAYAESVSPEFIVKEDGIKVFAKNVLNASNSNYFDYVLIRKTGDYKYLDVESTLPDTLSYVKGTPEDEKPKLSDYVKVSTNALKTVAAFYTTAKVEAGADKATAQYTAYETEDAAKAAMSEPGLYYCFGRIVGLFSMTDLNDYKEVFTDTIVVEVKEAEAEPVSAHTWDFTQWSDATITNLKADAAASKISGWSDVEKKADAEAGVDPTELSKDNCFWFAGEANADGQLEANGVVIEELKGLTFPTTAYNSARSIAIAVNYQLANADLTKAFGPYDGASYFWLGGKEKDCFVINNVKAGTEIKMGVESHKITDARGVKLYVKNGESRVELKGTDGEAVAAPTVYADQTWVVTSGAATAKGTSLSANVAAEELVDVIVYNTNGCHIYFIDAEIGEPTPDAIQTVEAETEAVKAVKFIKDGKLIIVSGGKQFNAAGAEIK